ncbi:hypothetical protein SLS61_000651 [Didymella pomorum]
MSLIRTIASLPLLWSCVTAAPPAGPGVWPNGTHSEIVGGDFNAESYGLIDNYDGTNWLNMFDVQDISDPTHGFVDYVNAQEAQQLGLLRTQGSQVYMGVDYTSTLDPNGPGRKSVRIMSKRAYNRALVIADFAHVPGSNCGSWPAFWMVGPNWPNQGEIDIYEGVHLNTYNQATLHTSTGCVPSVGPGGETGQRVGNADCGAGGGYNGCGVASNSPTSYGTAFNANGGGVYATLWTNSGIKVCQPQSFADSYWLINSVKVYSV